MLKRFPGRTLDEIDQMDWGRYLKVIEIERMFDLEGKLSLYEQEKIQSTDITPDEWEQIAEHDRLAEL